MTAKPQPCAVTSNHIHQHIHHDLTTTRGILQALVYANRVCDPNLLEDALKAAEKELEKHEKIFSTTDLYELPNGALVYDSGDNYWEKIDGEWVNFQRLEDLEISAYYSPFNYVHTY